MEFGVHINPGLIIECLVTTYIGIMTIYTFRVENRKKAKQEKLNEEQAAAILAEKTETERLADLLADREDDFDTKIDTVRDLLGKVISQSNDLNKFTEREIKENLTLYTMLQALFSASQSAMIVCNNDGRILLWNDAAVIMFGYLEIEAVGQNVLIIIPENLHGAHLAGMQRYRTTGQSKMIGHVIRLEALHKDGSKIPVYISLGASELALHETYFCAVITRITQEELNAETS